MLTPRDMAGNSNPGQPLLFQPVTVETTGWQGWFLTCGVGVSYLEKILDKYVYFFKLACAIKRGCLNEIMSNAIDFEFILNQLSDYPEWQEQFVQFLMRPETLNRIMSAKFSYQSILNKWAQYPEWQKRFFKYVMKPEHKSQTITHTISSFIFTGLRECPEWHEKMVEFDIKFEHAFTVMVAGYSFHWIFWALAKYPEIGHMLFYRCIRSGHMNKQINSGVLTKENLQKGAPHYIKDSPELKSFWDEVGQSQSLTETIALLMEQFVQLEKDRCLQRQCARGIFHASRPTDSTGDRSPLLQLRDFFGCIPGYKQFPGGLIVGFIRAETETETEAEASVESGLLSGIQPPNKAHSGHIFYRNAV